MQMHALVKASMVGIQYDIPKHMLLFNHSGWRAILDGDISFAICLLPTLFWSYSLLMQSRLVQERKKDSIGELLCSSYWNYKQYHCQVAQTMKPFF